MNFKVGDLVVNIHSNVICVIVSIEEIGIIELCSPKDKDLRHFNSARNLRLLTKLEEALR